MIRHRTVIHTQNSILAIVVGVVFICDSIFDGNLFNRYPDTYRFMRFWPSYVWGSIYASAGVAHLIAIQLDWHSTRKAILLLKGGLWVFLAVCVVYGDIYAAAGWCYFVFATFAIITYWKMRRNPDTHYEIHQSIRP